MPAGVAPQRDSRQDRTPTHT